MSDRRIEYMSLAELLTRRAIGNPKSHDDALIERSINRFGFVEPITIDERTGHLVAGHGRLDELERGFGAGEVPPEGVQVSDADWLIPAVRGWSSRSDDEAKAYLVVSNQSTIAGGWHDDLLAVLLESLKTSDQVSFEATGFSDKALGDLLSSLGRDQEPKPEGPIPDPPSEPVTQPGDLWLLGGHRLLCGDCTQPASFEALIRENTVALVVTDPPYGVAIGAKNELLSTFDNGNRASGQLSGDEGMATAEQLWKTAFPTIRDAVEPGTSFYIFGPQGGDLGLLLLLRLRDCGLPPRHILIWAKNRASFSLGRLDYDYAHEPIVYGWKPGAAHRWHASEPQSSLLSFDRPQRSPDHPTVKPVDLLAQLIRNSALPREIVLDPFCGSGSTIIAADQTGRIGYGIEISPGYCDVILERFHRVTGLIPTREADGAPFPVAT